MVITEKVNMGIAEDPWSQTWPWFRPYGKPGQEAPVFFRDANIYDERLQVQTPKPYFDENRI